MGWRQTRRERVRTSADLVLRGFHRFGDVVSDEFPLRLKNVFINRNRGTHRKTCAPCAPGHPTRMTHKAHCHSGLAALLFCLGSRIPFTKLTKLCPFSAVGTSPNTTGCERPELFYGRNKMQDEYIKLNNLMMKALDELAAINARLDNLDIKKTTKKKSNPIFDLVASRFDWSSSEATWSWITLSEVVSAIGIARQNKNDKDLASCAICEMNRGQRKRSKSARFYLVPPVIGSRD